MTHWAVTVFREGEEIVTIESNCLSGREITPEDEDAIRTAANHLLAFIGEPTPTGPLRYPLTLPRHARSSQQMPDPLRGAWWLTVFFRLWFLVDRR